MDRRRQRVSAGLMVLVGSTLLICGSAAAHGSVAEPQLTEAKSCKIHTLASFVDQGEFALEGTVADVAEVECDPTVYPPGSTVEITDAQLFSRCEGEAGGGIKWVETNEFGVNKIATAEGRGVTVGLDADGNATVALVAGPHCAVGDTVISGHTEGPEFESFSASFATLAPRQTPEGVTALPAKQVEDAGSSSAATIIEGEFPGASETMMRLASPGALQPLRSWGSETDVAAYGQGTRLPRPGTGRRSKARTGRARSRPA